MKIPASKAWEWANIIRNNYYSHYNETNRKYFEQARDLFHKAIDASERLNKLIPDIQKEINTNKVETLRISQIFTQVLAGPIMSLRDYTRLILSFPFWHPE